LKYIEFLGVSGVGKTTLFRELVKRRTKDDHWISPEEATIQIAKDKAFSDVSTNKKKLFLGLLKSGVLRNRHYGMAMQILEDTDAIEQAFWAIGDRHNQLFDIHLRCVAEDSEIEPRRKARVVSFYLQRVQEMMVMDYNQVKQVVVFDDGLLHNHGYISKIDCS